MHYRKNLFDPYVTMTFYGPNGAKVTEKTVMYRDVHDTLRAMRERDLPVTGISAGDISPYETRSFSRADGSKLTVRPAVRNNPSTKAERHSMRAVAYAGYKPKSKKFYVVVTTPPSGVRMEGPYSSHEEAAERRKYVQGRLSNGNAFVKGEATLKRQGLL